MRTIISTVGTSLMTNAARRGLGDAPDEAKLVSALASTPAAEACAESNALEKLGAGREDRLVFLHSDTPEGERCARALKTHYNGIAADVEVRRVAHLSYEHRGFKQRGIKQLVDELAYVIGREQRAQREVVVNATGGFKAEIAYATLVGLLFHVPVVYVHERFNDIVELPVVPMQWDYSLLALHAGFFEWIDEEPRPSGQIRERLRALPPALKMLVDEHLVDGHGGLNAAGDALYRAFKAMVAASARSAVALSTRARETLDSLDPSTRAGFEQLLGNLEVRDLWLQQSDWMEAGEMRVYPRGGRTERILFYEQGDEIRVCELARHSDGTYERLLERRIKRADYHFPERV